MSTDIKRSEFRTFLNTVPAGPAAYNLVGDGITTAKVNLNPKTTEETYIHEDVARISVDSYAPTLPVEASAKKGDAVFEFVDDIYRNLKVGADCETDIINVYLYETPVGGAYPAMQHLVSAQVDDFGGDGGVKNKISFTLNYRGTPVPGMFDPVTKTFTPD
jgi:hypothetical protein